MAKLEDILADKKTYTDETTIQLTDGTTATLGELRSGFMKDADYRKKTSDLAREREAFDRDRATQQAAIIDAQKQLRELAESVQKANPAATRDEVMEAIASDPIASRLAREIASLKQVLTPMAQALVEMDTRQKQAALGQVTEQHRRVLTALKKDDPELNEDELVDFAKKNYIPRLDHAYTLMKNEDKMAKAKETAREEGLKAGYEKAKTELAAPMIPIRRAPEVNANAPKNLDEAVGLALKDPEVIGPLVGIR